MKKSSVNLNYKWKILALLVLTYIFVIAIPTMSMSVLAHEISVELELSVVQVGIVWGIGAFPGIVTGLLGGAIGDKIGPKKVIIFSTLMIGLLGAVRGFAPTFISLTLISFFLGAVMPILIMNGTKTCGIWFPSHLLGLANGFLSAGMAFGFLVGSLTSATFLSPLLGGWRIVLVLYGIIGMLTCIPWFFTQSSPEVSPIKRRNEQTIWQSIIYISRLKNIWLLGFTLLGFGGCIQGVLGYLPLYLRSMGWDALHADGALATFHSVSMLSVLPIAILSDRLNLRKPLMKIAFIMVISGMVSLSFASTNLVWFGVLIAGMVRDAFMAIFFTVLIETKGIGPSYAGTATGFALAISGIGNLLAPPLGNSFVTFSPQAPFIFWALLSLLGLVCLTRIKSEHHSIRSTTFANG